MKLQKIFMYSLLSLVVVAFVHFSVTQSASKIDPRVESFAHDNLEKIVSDSAKFKPSEIRTSVFRIESSIIRAFDQITYEFLASNKEKSMACSGFIQVESNEGRISFVRVSLNGDCRSVQ